MYHLTPGDTIEGNLMPSVGKYGTAVFEARRPLPKCDFLFLIGGTIPDLDPWTYYNLPVLGIDELAAGARGSGTLGSRRIEMPTKMRGLNQSKNSTAEIFEASFLMYYKWASKLLEQTPLFAEMNNRVFLRIRYA